MSHNQNHELSYYKFIIKIDKSDTKKLSTNMEELINFWVLPKAVNKVLEYEEAIGILVSGKNEIPIWIGVEIIDNHIHLTISKRFRQWKVVNQWHSNNETIPFIHVSKLRLTDHFKEFRFFYPAAMYDDQKIECEEFHEIINVMNIGVIDFAILQDLIWGNVENPNADILKFKSKDSENEYMLIDLWNSDQINVMNLYFKLVGANIDFVRRSLSRWNNRLWGNLGPKIEEIKNIDAQENIIGRNIIEAKNAGIVY